MNPWGEQKGGKYMAWILNEVFILIIFMMITLTDIYTILIFQAL